MFRFLVFAFAVLASSVASGLEVRVFYNESAFDRHSEAVTKYDQQAIAIDKVALRPGQTATFSNYTSYDRGINGVAVTLAEGESIGSVSVRSGNAVDISTWTTAKQPAITTIGSVAYLTWPDRTFVGVWIELNIGGELYYFGNAPGESGNSSSNTFVDGSDFAGARDNPHTPTDPAAIDDRYDYNRDSLVDDEDKAIATNHATNFLTALKLISP